MIEKLAEVFAENTLGNIGSVLTHMHQLIVFFEKNIPNETLKNAAIDAVIQLLEAQKTNNSAK